MNGKRGPEVTPRRASLPAEVSLALPFLLLQKLLSLPLGQNLLLSGTFTVRTEDLLTAVGVSVLLRTSALHRSGVRHRPREISVSWLG